MFLKLFPRYAGRARRGATVAGDHLRGTAVVVENAPKCYSSRCSAIHDPYCSDYVWSERTEKVAKRGKRRGWQYVMRSVMQRVGASRF